QTRHNRKGDPGVALNLRAKMTRVARCGFFESGGASGRSPAQRRRGARDHRWRRGRWGRGALRWPEPLAGALQAVTSASIAGKTDRRFRQITRGITGEAVVAERLGSLPNDYFLLNDVALPGQPGNIDHVVIGPCWVVVIETKNFSGPVESHGSAWFVNGRRVRSISTQANRGAIAVREALTRTDPDLKDSVLRFVDSIAVFANPPSRLTVDLRAPPRLT